jgi:hypothetical protein
MATVAEQRIYLVYFHTAALDVLGDAVKPYLTEAPEGKHLRCKEIDSAGGFFECELSGTGPDGKPLDVEALVPSSMIRLVISSSGNEIDFGFG